MLRLTAEGYTGQEIGERLVLSPKTVDTYRQRVMEKLNLHHRSELVKYALRKGLLQPDAPRATSPPRLLPPPVGRSLPGPMVRPSGKPLH